MGGGHWSPISSRKLKDVLNFPTMKFLLFSIQRAGSVSLLWNCILWINNPWISVYKICKLFSLQCWKFFHLPNFSEQFCCRTPSGNLFRVRFSTNHLRTNASIVFRNSFSLVKKLPKKFRKIHWKASLKVPEFSKRCRQRVAAVKATVNFYARMMLTFKILLQTLNMNNCLMVNIKN